MEDGRVVAAGSWRADVSVEKLHNAIGSSGGRSGASDAILAKNIVTGVKQRLS